MLKKILIGLLIVFIIIQFFRPEKNQAGNNQNDIITVHSIPENVHTLLKRACYDCHSNYTTYPWYNNIQPVAWWLQNHINEGKHHLNFSEFATYTAKKQAHKLEETAEMIEKVEMPLESYTWIHRDALLTKKEATLLINWSKELQQQITKTIK